MLRKKKILEVIDLATAAKFESSELSFALFEAELSAELSEPSSSLLELSELPESEDPESEDPESLPILLELMVLLLTEETVLSEEDWKSSW